MKARTPLERSGWRTLRAPLPPMELAIAHRVVLEYRTWRRGPVVAVSSVLQKTVLASNGVTYDLQTYWQLDISAIVPNSNESRRCTEEESRQALVCFGLNGARELTGDLQDPIRQFVLAVDPAQRTREAA